LLPVWKTSLAYLRGIETKEKKIVRGINPASPAYLRGIETQMKEHWKMRI